MPLPPTKHFIKNMQKEFMDEIIPIAFRIPSSSVSGRVIDPPLRIIISVNWGLQGCLNRCSQVRITGSLRGGEADAAISRYKACFCGAVRWMLPGDCRVAAFRAAPRNDEGGTGQRRKATAFMRWPCRGKCISNEKKRRLIAEKGEYVGYSVLYCPQIPSQINCSY